MLFEPPSQIASRTDIRLCWERAGLQQGDVIHDKAGLPAVARSVLGLPAFSRATPKAFGAPALDLRSAPSEGWSG